MRKLVSAKELAKELNVSLFTIYQAKKNGRIKTYGLEKPMRFDLAEILETEQ
jgi:transposase